MKLKKNLITSSKIEEACKHLFEGYPLPANRTIIDTRLKNWNEHDDNGDEIIESLHKDWWESQRDFLESVDKK